MKRIITIGRQYCALGGEIGKELSRITGIPVYDRESLVEIALKHGIPRETFEKADEQATSSFLYSMAMSSYSGSLVHFGVNENSITDRVFNIQSTEIRRIADEGSCIIVGRCADDILSGYEGLLKVFVHAPYESRIAEYLSLNPDADENSARKQINKFDKKRASYYNFYTGKGWGDPKNYHLNVDSSVLGDAGTAELIKCFSDLMK